ncbi:P-loop containing nucleoside triphosphate hydrolase protein [Ephemerocybe angulata]|uniref:DNA 3'-5' helicase n=1 Tax=Ephemerocybe angulata TaxID=980116 RepID=A0A8H6MDP1_9AGAR|nr:P-loop containing nucleoside triphosphate hydrolase protein [Tulosesus angulatus]KAF6764729.1 P-loop containing nucleoside triphosphate hydrolase protein [Tulosesus angulatus]
MPSKPPWTTSRIRELAERYFNKRLCAAQVEVIKKLAEKKDVIACLPTGAGKTLTFWMPVLMAKEDGLPRKLTFVVTPLNLLGKQNKEQLIAAGIRATCVTAENATKATFKAIESGEHDVVIINPEILMSSPHLEILWKSPAFTSRIINFIFDEGHCISKWGTFRKDYRTVGRLRHLIPDHIPFYVASATLPSDVISDIKSVLQLRADSTAYISRSNDRPDIRLLVRVLQFSLKSFRDLDFLLAYAECWKPGDPLPAKFLIFFDNLKDAEAACRIFRARLPEDHPLKEAVHYFHSTMSSRYREQYLEAMQAGTVWGLFCTDAFGMGMDIPDIEIAIQWKATVDLCTLWQRFGRVARGPGKVGTAILLVEKKDTAEERAAKEKKAEEKKKKAQDKKKKAEEKADKATLKRAALDQGNQPTKRRVLGDRMGVAVNGEAGPSGSRQPIALNEQPAPPTAVTAAITKKVDDVEARRARYSRAPASESNKTKRFQSKGVEIGSAMDDFINAHVCHECRRVAPNVYFHNDKALTPVVCCDVCDPEEFKEYSVEFVKPVRGPGKSSVASLQKTPMDDATATFKASLYEWRKTKASEKFKPSTIRQLGTKVLMADEILNRVIECARARKLTDLESIRRETSWRYADELGLSLLELIKFHFPSPSSAPLVPGPANANDATSEGVQTVARRKRAPQKCSIQVLIQSALKN